MQQMHRGNAAKMREDATNARVKSRDVRKIITGLGVQQMQGSATNAKTVATDANSATNAETGATNAVQQIRRGATNVTDMGATDAMTTTTTRATNARPGAVLNLCL